MSETEWMTIAANVISVNSNWSGGVVGNGYIYSGHGDNSPNNALDASSVDSDGYYGTGNSGDSQRRTLTLTNGEVIWDFAGNVWEWTNETIGVDQQPGVAGESSYTWREWNDGSYLVNGLAPTSRAAAIGGVESYTSSQGIGQLNSKYTETNNRAYRRGGTWTTSSRPGILTLSLNNSPTSPYANVGFRVTR